MAIFSVWRLTVSEHFETTWYSSLATSPAVCLRPRCMITPRKWRIYSSGVARATLCRSASGWTTPSMTWTRGNYSRTPFLEGTRPTGHCALSDSIIRLAERSEQFCKEYSSWEASPGSTNKLETCTEIDYQDNWIDMIVAFYHNSFTQGWVFT